MISPALMSEKSKGVSLVEVRGTFGGGGVKVPFAKVHIGFLTDKVRIATAYSFNFGEGVHDLLFSIDVGVEETKDELEVGLLS